MTFRAARKQAERCLSKAGIADAQADAWYLLEFAVRQVTGQAMSRSDALLRGCEEMDPALYEAYEALLQRRLQHMPLQYLTGEQEFFGYPFTVSEDVLIPRQDTELLVREAVRILHPGMSVLDLCTGSGCILLSILKTVPGCRGTGADLSGPALAVAKENAARLGCRADFVQSDLFAQVEGTFDLIVSNPPYIPSGELAHLMPEVRDHEPWTALDGKEDGLFYYREIVRQSAGHLTEGGILLFEIGSDQREAVCALLSGAGFTSVWVLQDLAHLDRVVGAC